MFSINQKVWFIFSGNRYPGEIKAVRSEGSLYDIQAGLGTLFTNVPKGNIKERVQSHPLDLRGKPVHAANSQLHPVFQGIVNGIKT